MHYNKSHIIQTILKGRELNMRFAVIGTNFVTDWFLEAGKVCEGFFLDTVYSRDINRANEYAKTHGAAYSTDSLENLAARAEAEAVYIASPTSLHYTQCAAMLRAKKHVLCEKPITSNLSELQSLLDISQNNNVSIMEAMRPAYTPGLFELKILIKEIGTVRRATFSFCQYSSRYDKFRAGETPNAFNPAYSNGALMDLGVYPVHIMLRLFGVPKSIQSCSVKLHNGIDGAGTILASFDDKIVDLKYSKISGSDNFSEIQGERGSLYFDEITRLSRFKISLRNSSEPKTVIVPTHEHDMIYELLAFMRLANSYEEMRKEHYYTIETTRILDEVRKQNGIIFPADQKPL